MTKLIERAVSAIWTSVAAVTIVIAIVVTIVRLMLPQIDGQRGLIEQWLSEITQRPIQIGEVKASWRGWSPTIDITELALKNADSEEELVRFDSAQIQISPLRSLFSFDLVPRRLVVSGIKVALERDVNGNISIAGMPPSRWPVAQWLLQQQNFTLTDAEISYTDLARASATAHFSNVTLSISHNAGGQQISGTFRRTHAEGEKYAFSLRSQGDLLGQSWEGDLYLRVNNADARETLALTGWLNNPIRDGDLNAEIWTRWKSASLQQAAIEIQAGKFGAGDITAKFKNLRAAGTASRMRDGWSIAVSQLQINDSVNSQNKAIGVRTRKISDGSRIVAVQAKAADLGTLSAILPDELSIPHANLPTLRSINVRGELSDLLAAVRYRQDHQPQFFIKTAVQNLSINGSQLPLSVEGLDFSITTNARSGRLRMAQQNPAYLRSDSKLVKPIQLNKLTGDVDWVRDETNLTIITDRLDVNAQSAEISLRGVLDWELGLSPDLTLVGLIESGDLSQFHHLVPKGALRPRGERWLRNAFQSGRFNASPFLLHGNLGDFPFDSGNGSFKAEFSVADVDLQYSQRWPQTRSIDATIAIDKRKAVTSIRNGIVFSSPVNESSIEMPDLFSNKPFVRVRGKMEIVPNNLTSFIAASPLKKTKAIRYSELDIADPFDMTLDMNLSLVPGGEKEILGLVHFDNNRIISKQQRITLDDFSGDISFTRQDFYGEGLNATFDGDRVGVVINGGLDDPNYDTEFRMTGTSDASKLFKNLKRYAPIVHSWLEANSENTSLMGTLPWKAVLTIPQTSEDGTDAPKRLKFESSLVGLDVDLPWPFSKRKNERKPLVITTETSSNGRRFTRIDFGSTVDAEIDQIKEATGRSITRRAEFVFGERKPKFAERPGISARGRIDRLPLNDWIVFTKAAQKVMRSPTNDTPTVFDINVDSLYALGRTFPDVNLSGNTTLDAWDINIESELALGKINLPRAHARQPLKINLEKLWLSAPDPTIATEPVDPTKLPAFELSCRSMRFGDIDLGETHLVASKTDTGLALETLSFSQPQFALQGSGNWRLESDIHHSQMDLSVQGRTLSGLLKSFGYEVANIDGGVTAMTIDAGWQGMPFEFSLDKLKGSFNLNVEKGRFLDIEPGGGRLFGLLSLQTLPRRISLDFNDLFRKGFTFDSIDGKFELDHGNAYTNSLSIAGPSARINISGRTGLADKDYDQHVTVTPALSNSIPVASALFGPAGIGVGAVIYLGQKMFKSIPEKVDKILSREYSITGNWKQPVIKRI